MNAFVLVFVVGLATAARCSDCSGASPDAASRKPVTDRDYWSDYATSATECCRCYHGIGKGVVTMASSFSIDRNAVKK